MERVTLFLRNALFTLPGGGHVPVGVTVIEGEIVSRAEDKLGGGPLVRTSAMKDDRGKTLSETPVLLVVPWAKIDHIHVREG